MKNYYKYLLIAIIMMIGLAMLPILAEAFSEQVEWENFASAYQTSKIFLPVIMH